MTTTAEQFAIRAAHATAAAWFPAETVTRPRDRSASVKERTLLSAPRALKDPVFWKLSHFKCSRTPASAPRPDEDKSGVRCVLPAIRSAATRISARSIMARLDTTAAGLGVYLWSS